MATTKNIPTGNDVRALREGLDMSTVEFGKLLGLGPSAVTRWESKKSRAVHMDPFAARVFEIIIAQAKKLGKTKFGALVRDALSHEHDLYALWQVLSMAFGETVRVVKKITGGKKNKKPTVRPGRQSRPSKRARKASKRSARATERRIRRSRATRSRPARRAARAKRAAKAAVGSSGKAKRARPPARTADPKPSPVSESKITQSAAKEAVESRENGVQ